MRYDTLNFGKMRKILFVISLISLFGCEKNNYNKTDTVFGVCYPDNLVPSDFVELNLNTGSIDSKGNIDGFQGLSSSQYQARSYDLNLYIYDVDPITVGFIDLLNLNIETVDIYSDTTILGIESLEVDEFSNTLYIVTTSFYKSKNQYWLSLIPIDLSTKTIMTKIDVVEVNSYTQYISEIDYTNQKIFIKQKSGSTLYSYDYSIDKIVLKECNVNYYDINYYPKENSLMGTTLELNKGFYLVSFSIENSEIKEIGKYQDIESIMQDFLFFDKRNSTYWIGTLNNENINKRDIIKVNLEDASVIKRVTLEKPVINVI